MDPNCTVCKLEIFDTQYYPYICTCQRMCIEILRLVGYCNRYRFLGNLSVLQFRNLERINNVCDPLSLSQF